MAARNIAFALLCASCAISTAPEREALVRPELAFSELQRGRMRDGGILYVETFAIDPRYRLGQNEYLPITVTSPVGEHEELRLKHTICNLADGTICRFFSVKATSGNNILALEDVLKQLNARLMLVGSSTFGSAYAFDDWSRTMAAAGRLEGVERVEYVRLLVATPDFPPFETLFAAAAPFVVGAPTPNDGIVSALTTDTLTISYAQPGGTVLTCQVAPPPQQ